MSQITTQILFPQTTYSNLSTVTGERRPAANYHLGNRDTQTLLWNLSGVTGRILIQATLVENPIGSDWFTVYTIDANNLTQISYANITGNFVWIRAQINMFSQGTIQSIKVSY
jgi:hypothetical protein